MFHIWEHICNPCNNFIFVMDGVIGCKNSYTFLYLFFFHSPIFFVMDGVESLVVELGSNFRGRGNKYIITN